LGHHTGRAGARRNAAWRWHATLPGHALVLAAGLAASVASRAAGGHHAVDDAALLEPGQCQVETWYERGSARSLLHVGPACRVAAVELGFDANRVRLSGDGTTSVAVAQVKWATAHTAAWSSGVVFGVAAQDRAPKFLGSVLIVPVTWQASETLLVHANLGRDFRHREPDATRAGVALEWTASAAWSLVAERFAEGRADFWRAGARWSASPSLLVDVSRARPLGGDAPAWWTVGLTWLF